MNVGVNTAVFHEGKVLLTKRDDFRIWCLPGGKVEDGETVPQGALRETFEETGLRVKLTGVIGIYSIPLTSTWVNLIISFKAEVIGGELNPQPGEVVDLRWFGRDEVPQELLWGQRQRILDAFDCERGGVAWKQSVPFHKVTGRAELYRMKDESGLNPAAFYAQQFGFEDHRDDLSELG
jgi:8-oxo-dGTP pyrophosphatase MutT (NUDIX family)